MRYNLTKYIFPAIIMIVAAFMMFYNLADNSIQDWDEGIYTLIVHESLTQGPRMMLTLMGEPWLEKPPAGFWLIYVGTEIFGFNSFGLRAMGSMAMIGSFLIIYFLLRRLYSASIAVLTTIVILFSPFWFYHHMSRSGDLEPFFLFFSWLAMYLYVVSWKNKNIFSLVGVALGASFLVRGFIVLLPLAAIAGHMVLTQRYKNYQARDIWFFLVALFLMVVPWHVYIWYAQPQIFWDTYVQSQFLDRITGPLQGHAGTWRYYLDFLTFHLGMAWYVMIWFWAVSLYFYIRNRDERTLLWCLWLGAFVVPLQIMRTKLFWYLHPIVPSLYILCLPGIVDSSTIVKKYVRAKIINAFILACISMYIVCTASIAWTKINSDFISGPQRLAEYMESKGWQEKSLAVYGIELWYGGHLLPAAAYYLQVLHHYDILTLDARVAPDYVLDPKYQLFFTDRTDSVFIRSLMPSVDWQEIDFGGSVLLLKIKK
jgi:4-amino-4-deoxy-L-arabinose transferase-like glycosyltransferase